MVDQLRGAFSKMRESGVDPTRVAIPRSDFDFLMCELGPVISAHRDREAGLLPLFDGVEIQVLEGR